MRPSDALAGAAALFAPEPTRFASVALVVVGPETVSWVNAGHNEPILLHRDGGVERLGVTGPVVSALGGRWEPRRTAWDVGDFLVVFTDGLVEARDERGDEVGDDRVIDWCRGLKVQADALPKGQGAAHVAHGLLDHARRTSVDLRRDDVTIVVVQRIGSGWPAAEDQVR
jgi:serine phosphatase RsbU (regulator of sigma subunit)